jgi:hypothetical protein
VLRGASRCVAESKAGEEKTDLGTTGNGTSAPPQKNVAKVWAREKKEFETLPKNLLLIKPP